jgi:Lrp/AsnC family transcriptional regulator, leucine-responsive regulatory protein
MYDVRTGTIGYCWYPAQQHRNGMVFPLDEKDRKLLDRLQEDARLTSTELGQQVGLSPSGVQKRLRKLEDAGVVQKYAAILDRRLLGRDLAVFVQVTIQGHTWEAVAQFDEAVQEMAEVLECHRVTGSADYLLKVIVRNHEELDHFLINRLVRLPSVERVNSNLVLKAVKETTHIVLGGEGDNHD